MARVLVVEDDEILARGLRVALEHEGHEVLMAPDGEEGVYQAKVQSPDLIILDIMMPHMNGFEVITELRRTGETVPVIVLSARSETRDKIRGLDLGADDYVTKPFDLDELLARVRRNLVGKVVGHKEFGKYRYEFTSGMLFEKETQLSIVLSSKEQKMLEFFIKRKDQILSRERIIDGVWGQDYEGTDRTVDNFILSLRKKVDNGHIQTVRGQGYRFVINP